MRSWLYVHGGDSFKSKADFIEHLRTVPLRESVSGGVRPHQRWSDTLAADLGEGVSVIAPTMPNKQNADYDEWRVWFERYLPLVRAPYGLLGWSQGGYFLSKYLSEHSLPVPPAAVVLVAAPAGIIDEPGGDNPAWEFNVATLAEVLARIRSKTFIFHSEDDPVVPYEHALRYAAALPNSQLVTCRDKGHFVIERFPELLDVLRNV